MTVAVNPHIEAHQTLDNLLQKVRACRVCEAHLPQIELTLLVGRYAQTHFLRGRGHVSVTASTRDWRAHAPRVIPLPHPSPRNIAWFKANPCFDDELVPVLRHTVHQLIGG